MKGRKSNSKKEKGVRAESELKLPQSVFDFSDNSKELLAEGLTWSDQAFRDRYKINLQLSQPLELPLQA